MLVVTSMALLVLPIQKLHAQTEISREARIQAVLILRMIKFVEWPTERLAPKDDLNICTWGDSATATALQSLEGQNVRDHAIVVNKLAPPVNTKGCHVVFVGDTVKDLSPGLLYGSGSRAVLTVSDMPEFNKSGGIINLIRQANRIGFDIQLRYAREHGLQIGAPLLELARVVN